MNREAAAPRIPGQSEEEQRAAQPASEGAGPLLQRDYLAVVQGSRCSPEEGCRLLRSDFPSFSPAELAKFTRPAGAMGLLGVGDTMHIVLRGAGECAVRVTHADARSLTLCTLEGHQEAGRITFALSCDAAGRLLLRIRSRARQRNVPRYVAYRLLGKHAQTRIWVIFLERLAEACGGRIVGKVITSTDEVHEDPADAGAVERPTLAVH